MVAAVAAAAVLGCTPHRGFGAITLVRGRKTQQIDLATCRRPKLGVDQPDIHHVGLVVRATHNSQSIVLRGRTVLKVDEVHGFPGPIELFGLSPDEKWALYAIDPYGSSSIAADGLTLRAVPVTGGRPRTIALGLLYDDYRAWCGSTFVMTAGFDRIATHDKRLVTAAAPGWRVRALVRAPGRAWGSLACAPDGRSVVVQSQRESDDGNFFHTHWALWRVGLEVSAHQLTHPPPGYADESPKLSRDGRTIMFVRSRKGVGKLYALREGKLVGPLLSLGYSLGYYGHQDWWQSMRWSLG